MSDTSVTTTPPVEPGPQRDAQGTLLDQSSTQTVTTPSSTSETASTTETPPTTTESPDGSTVLTKPKDGETKSAAPEKYADFKAPDGYTIDPKTIEAATPIFKELGLSQEAAQKLVTFHTEQLLAAAKGPQDAYTATRTEWQSKVQADPELKAATSGGKTGLDAVKLDIGRALNSIGDPTLVNEFKQAMDITGAGDHPAFVKAFWKLSQHLTEGTHVSGAGPSKHGQQAPDAKPKSIANAMYPNLP